MSITVLKYFRFYVHYMQVTKQCWSAIRTFEDWTVCMLCMCLLQSTFFENNGILFNVTHTRTDQLHRVLFLDGLCWQQAAERAYIRCVGENTSFSLFSFCSK